MELVDGCCVAGRGQFAEFQSPKMRRRRQELHANSLAPLAGLSLKNHAALLLFQSFRVRQNEHFAVVDFVLQKQQPAVRVDHHGFARLFEFLSVMRAALRLYAHLVECPSAASVCRRRRLVHTAIIGCFAKQRPLALGTGVLQAQPSAALARRCRKPW